ncbi:MFS transporter [Legionella septentrionalis]|uniref:MFS transporter n=1 Tax=Legionella septentrionalis TaxID=2498109 RepID=A0A433JH15_9GAMM|nr:DUF456 domain-containing protein [Legionella septentrionalis]RUQ81560.1 MFS transporter [Legionella septentrionalis]
MKTNEHIFDKSVISIIAEPILLSEPIEKQANLKKLSVARFMNHALAFTSAETIKFQQELSSSDFDFSEKDKKEIGRGASYAITDGLKELQKAAESVPITIELAQKELQELGITEARQQNFILGLVLQSRIGWPFTITRTLQGLLGDAAYEYDTGANLVISSGSTQITYDAKTNCTYLSTATSLKNKHTESLTETAFAEIHSVIAIGANQEATLQEIKICLLPANELTHQALKTNLETFFLKEGLRVEHDLKPSAWKYLKHIVLALTGLAAAGTIGAAIGTAILPGVGTAIGAGFAAAVALLIIGLARMIFGSPLSQLFGAILTSLAAGSIGTGIGALLGTFIFPGLGTGFGALAGACIGTAAGGVFTGFAQIMKGQSVLSKLAGTSLTMAATTAIGGVIGTILGSIFPLAGTLAGMGIGLGLGFAITAVPTLFTLLFVGIKKGIEKLQQNNLQNQAQNVIENKPPLPNTAHVVMSALTNAEREEPRSSLVLPAQSTNPIENECPLKKRGGNAFFKVHLEENSDEVQFSETMPDKMDRNSAI